VGRLGQLDRLTRIYRTPSSSSMLLTTAPVGTYVAIQRDSGNWLGVLMADGSMGWLRSDHVQLLDYQVVSNGSAPMPTGGSDVFPSSSVPLLTTDPQAILNEAYKYMGVRYVWGGNGFGGIDCSGFVKNVFAASGYRLPRTATEQMAYGVAVPSDQLQAGDRLYFGHKKDGSGVTHTGIYIGNGYFIHSSSSRKGVAVSRLDEAMFARIYVCARR
jgi:N-acetylmuramoyl-L-alanine amidase